MTRRALPRPDDHAIRAAFEKSAAALARILTALGTGVHTLSYAAQDVDGRFVVETATITITIENDSVNDFQGDRRSTDRVHKALTFGLEGSVVRSAVLLAVTSRPGAPAVVCGWRVTEGWFRPLHPDQLVQVVLTGYHRGGPLPQRYTAPNLLRLPDPH